MPEQPSPVHFRNPEKPLGPAACTELYGARTSSPGEVTCFACRQSTVLKQAQEIPTVGEILTNHPLIKGVGIPTPGAPVTFEFEGDKHSLPVIPLLAAFQRIRNEQHGSKPAAQYDIVEWRRPSEGATVGIHLWLWPHDPNSTPFRLWILPDGTADLFESVDWITHEEWPEHIITKSKERT